MTLLLLLQSRIDTLDAWQKEGLTFRLCPDTGGFQWKAGALTGWQREHLREKKAEFAEALRFRAGLCIACGGDPVKHPRLNPKVPPLFCTSCYDRGAWENWCLGLPMKGGPKGAGSAKKGTDDGMFDGIGEEAEDAESLFSADTRFA